MGTTVSASTAWPPIPWKAWQDTCATVHMWTQIVGKTRLALAPSEPHWWHVPLYVTSRGLTTSSMPAGDHTATIDFDFIDHTLLVQTSDGATGMMPLLPQSVADFYRGYMETLREMALPVTVRPVPVEVETAIPFAEDRTHASYDAPAVHRFWQALVRSDSVLKRFRGRFLGKASPVHFFWGSFDLAATRFSGRPAPRHPGGVPNCPDYVMEDAYSHECSSCGFWPGNAALPEPAFYSYAYPGPEGFRDAAVPEGAYFSESLGEFILPYEIVRVAPNPEALLLDFLERTYAAAADLGRWNRTALEREYRDPT